MKRSEENPNHFEGSKYLSLGQLAGIFDKTDAVGVLLSSTLDSMVVGFIQSEYGLLGVATVYKRDEATTVDLSHFDPDSKLYENIVSLLERTMG